MRSKFILSFQKQHFIFFTRRTNLVKVALTKKKENYQHFDRNGNYDNTSKKIIKTILTNSQVNRCLKKTRLLKMSIVVLSNFIGT